MVIKKIIKILLWSAGGFFLLLFAMVFLLRTARVQTLLTQKIAAYLSTELKTRIEVKGVDIDFFKNIVLEGFYAEDLHHDTLIAASKLKLNISSLALSENKIYLKKISIEEGGFFLRKYKGEKELNLGFLIDYFSSKDTTASAPWKITCDDIQLDNISFKYRDENEPQVKPGVDYFDLEARNVHADIANIVFNRDTLTADIKQLSLKEKSGFVLNDFHSEVYVSSKKLSFKELFIKTFQSEIHGEYVMDYHDYSDFSDFIKKVHLHANFDHSKVAVRDIAFFAPILFPVDKQLVLNHASISGTIDNLKGKNLDLEYAESTHFQGDLRFSGLPEFSDTYIDLVVREFKSSYKDLKTLPSYPFAKGENLFIPEQMAGLGDLHFNGKFNGFVNDFVAYGTLQSSLGKIISDVNLKHDVIKNNTFYSGHIATENFNLGKLFGQENLLQNVSLNINVNGSGFSRDDLATGLAGNISQVDVLGYDYKNINLNGHITGNVFEGAVHIKDENVNLDFDGFVNYSRQKPFFNFTANIVNAKLDKLHLLNLSSHANPVLSTDLTMHFSGLNIEDFEGNIDIEKTHYAENGKEYRMDNLEFKSIHDGDLKNFKLNSDFADATMHGKFKSAEIPTLMKGLYLRYAGRPDKDSLVLLNSTSNFNFDIQLKNSDALSEVLLDDIYISNRSFIRGTLNAPKRLFNIHADFPFIHYREFQANQVVLNGSESGQNYQLGLNFSNLNHGERLLLNSVGLDAKLSNGIVGFSLHLKEDKTANEALIHGEMFLKKSQMDSNHLVSIKFDPSQIFYRNSDWTLSSDSIIDIDKGEILVGGFRLKNKNQSIGISGLISSNSADKLLCEVSNFELENLQQFFSDYHLNIHGKLNGNAHISGLYGNMAVESDFDLNELLVNSDSLGKAHIRSRWDNDKHLADIDASLSIGKIKNIEILGTINMLDKKNPFNLDVKVRKLHVKHIESFVQEYISDLAGIATADAHLSGSFDNPYFEGKLILQRSGFLFNYLNTSYNFSDEFIFNSYEVLVKQVKLNDVNGNSAIVDGKITHHNFSNMKYDFNIKANNFQALNTFANQNDLYYGTAFITGSVQLLGTNDNLNLNIAAKSDKGSKKDKGTRLFIPLSNTSEITSNNYISFVKNVPDSLFQKNDNKYKVDLSGIQMNFDLEATTDAEIQLIFDSKVGDIMKGRGTGNLKMAINTLGNFNMYGDFVVEEGDYNLTLQNTISRHFKVEKGGYIRWSGDPFEADMKMRAFISVDAPLSDLVQSPEEKYKRKIPIECLLDLSGKIMNPAIKFDLRVPGVDRETQDLITRSVPNEFEMNNQVFSLWVLKRFKAPETSEGKVQSGNIMQSSKANIYEFVGSQFNNWLSQNNLGIDFDLKYTPGNLESKENILVGGKKGLFDDRVIIDAKVGNSQYTASNLVGEFSLDVKASKDGKVRFKAFNKANNNNFSYNSSPYTQGISVFYREEFDTLGELFRRYMAWRREDKPNKTGMIKN